MTSWRRPSAIQASAIRSLRPHQYPALPSPSSPNPPAYTSVGPFALNKTSSPVSQCIFLPQGTTLPLLSTVGLFTYGAMALFLSIRVPRPQRFLNFFSLRTGVTIILFTFILNKATAVYGILAPLTGHPLNTLQAIMYIYSLPVLAVAVYISPYLRSMPPSPVHSIAWAYLYILDSLINAAFTAAFGVAWFVVLAQHPASVPGQEMIDKTAGFTSPQHNVSQVAVIASPAPGLLDGQDATAVGVPHEAVGLSRRGLTEAVFDRGSIMSVTVISILWALRFYACAVCLSYARSVLRSHIANNSSSAAWYDGVDDAPNADSKQEHSDLAPNPFHTSRPEGQGWQGNLGRSMLKIGPQYWLGRDDDADEERWVRGVGGRFNRKAAQVEREPQVSPTGGVLERERRRRSGTGPPEPSLEITGRQTPSL